MFAEGPSAQILEHVTNLLNPKADSSAVLVVREWESEKVARQDSYQAFFQGQDVLLLRKTLPETDCGRSILLWKNSMWIELPSARRPLQLSPEQRLTSEAMIADLARANFKRDYTVTGVTEELQARVAAFCPEIQLAKVLHMTMSSFGSKRERESQSAQPSELLQEHPRKSVHTTLTVKC